MNLVSYTAQELKPKQGAPKRALEAIEAAATLPFDEGCRREREIFNKTVVSDQAKALIHAFSLNEQPGKVPGIGKSPAKIERVAIIGAGTMGGGIAMVCADAGLAVLLKETKAEALAAGLATIQRNYETSVRRGRLTGKDVEALLALIHPQLDYAGFETADLIIEAAFESMVLKKQIFAEIDGIALRGCILASKFGPRWEPAPLLQRLAAEGRGFREYGQEREAEA